MGEVRNSSTDDLITKYTFIADGQKVWEWKHKGAGSDNTPNSYAFTYDPLSRLTDSQLFQYSNDQWQRSGSFEEWLGAGDVDAYDKNGNILSLMRSSATGSIMDGFRYEYNGNQLTKLYLDWEDDSDFVTYDYDANGNCTVDGLNALKLEYNYLNLTGAVRDISDNPLAAYRWLADGTKVGVKDANGAGFEYLGSLIYTRDGNDLDLESASFGGGRINKTINDYEVNYFLADHLGSTRTVFNSTSGTVSERNDYYSFGKRIDLASSIITNNRFRYSGKEEQGIFGLPYNDHGARMYDPITGRWGVIDPKAIDYVPISPYAYVGNNPIRLIDPDGMSWKEGWKYLKQSFSLRVSAGIQGSAKVVVSNVKIGVDLNIISGDIVKVDGNAENKISSGDIRQGMELGIGVTSAKIEQISHENEDGTFTRTTTKEARVCGVGVENTTTEQLTKNRDGTYSEQKNESKENTEFNVADVSVGVSLGIGVEIKLNTKLLVKGLDEILNK